MRTYHVKRTERFDRWFKKLDKATQARIDFRLRRAGEGHFGDHHGVGGEVSEMRLDFGPGYRLYYTVWEYRGQALLLLVGGDKSTQNRDIERAKTLVAEARAQAEREIDAELEQEQEERRNGQ